MDFETDKVLVGDTTTHTTTNAEASGSGTGSFPPNLAALPVKTGKNPTGINGKRPSRELLFLKTLESVLLISSTIEPLVERCS
jgi:hypothetical protein